MHISLKHKLKFHALALLFVTISCILPLLTETAASADSPVPSGAFQYSSGNKTITGPTNCDSGSQTVVYKQTGKDGIYEYRLTTEAYHSCFTDVQTSSKKYDGSTGGIYTGEKTSSSRLGTHVDESYGGKNAKVAIAAAGAGAGPTGSTSTKGQWVDVSTITVGSDTYFDDQIDDNLTFKLQGGDDCTSKSSIEGFKGSASNSGNAKVTAKIHIYQVAGNGNNNCVELVKGGQNINFSDTNNYLKYFTWDDSGTISTSDKSGIIFVQDSTDKNLFRDDGSGRSGDSTCQSQITVSASNPTQGTLILKTSGDRKLDAGWQKDIANAKLNPDGKGCKVSGKIPITIANPTDPATGKAANTLAAGSSNLSGGGKSASGSCESNAGPLGWIMCALIETLADAVNGIYSAFIVPMLQAPSLETNSASGSKIFSAWSSFRVFGNIFLVIVVLVIVFGESIGGGTIDAYTIRKVLPRILLSAIMINLSYYGVSLFIDFSNIIGNGVRLLITGPFGLDGNSFNLGTFGAKTQATGGAVVGLIGISAVTVTGIAVAVTGGAIILYAFYVLITAILIPLLFIFIAIMGVLALRLGLLYLLVLASPIACALWVLPNTERYFRQWFNLLQTTALVYPIISALFGVSMVLGQTTLWSGGRKGGVLALASYVIAIIIVVMPLVLIPFAFQLAGGILGRAYELANGQATRGRGAYNKWRKERLDPLAKGGNLFPGARPNGILGRLNRGMQRGGSLGARDIIHPTRASSRYKSTHATHAIEASDEALKAPAVVRGVSNDDIINATRSGDKSRESAYAHLIKIGYDEDEAAAGAEYIEEMRRVHGRDAFDRAAAIRNSATGTGYKGYTAADGTQVSGATEMVQALLEASHGDMSVFADSLSKAREAAKQGNRPDLYGIGFTDTLLIGRQLEKGEITVAAASKLLSENAVIKRGMGEQVTQREFSVQTMVGGEVHASNADGEKLYYDANGGETTSEWVYNADGVKIAQNQKKTAYKPGTLDNMARENEVELKASEAALQAAQASGDPAKIKAADERKNRAQRAEATIWAQIADGQDNIGRASMENRKDWAGFMNQEVEVVKYEMVPVPVMDLSGHPAIDRNTNLPVTKLERRKVVDPATQQPVFERVSRMKALETKRTEDLVLEQRREYSNQYAAAAAGAAAPPGVPAPGDQGTPGLP